MVRTSWLKEQLGFCLLQPVRGGNIWILTDEAAQAHLLAAAPHRSDQASQAQVPQRVRACLLADLLHGVVCRYQFVVGSHVHAQITWMFDRRRRNSEMDFTRACLAQQLDDTRGRRTPND